MFPQNLIMHKFLAYISNILFLSELFFIYYPVSYYSNYIKFIYFIYYLFTLYNLALK